ncbi:MAG: DUF6514 family protein [Oscillospiraceae bacterium]|nr:DUF6514 family protein [Oscillospiraceae bacterium]
MRKESSLPTRGNTDYNPNTNRPIPPSLARRENASKINPAVEFPYLYCVMQETYTTPDVSAYTGYGIAVYQRQGERMDLQFTIPDISTKQGFITGLVDMLNEFEVEYAHLFDVIEDYLYLYL